MSSPEIVVALKRLLGESCQIGATTLFPSLLIAVQQEELAEARKPGTMMADLALEYFLRAGLHGERTRQNLHGYPGILLDLKAPPPWVEVTPEDSETPLSPEREEQLLPVYRQAIRANPWDLLQPYRNHLERPRAILEPMGYGPALQLTNTLCVELFREELELARCLGVGAFEAVFDSVLEDWDDFAVRSGAPDLLIWSERNDLWFFAEVKGPGDALRTSQTNWVREEWETIKGRFVVVIMDEA